jgi:hypothetical protein
MQLYRIYSYLRLWQEGTRFKGFDFYQLLSIYQQVADNWFSEWTCQNNDFEKLALTQNN